QQVRVAPNRGRPGVHREPDAAGDRALPVRQLDRAARPRRQQPARRFRVRATHVNASDLLPAQFNVATWFVDRNLAEGRGASPALAEARYLQHVLVAGGAPGRYLSYEQRVAQALPKLAAADTSRDDAAYWQYSSGSTGFPKGAVHLHHDMVICCETYGKHVLA